MHKGHNIKAPVDLFKGLLPLTESVTVLWSLEDKGPDMLHKLVRRSIGQGD